MNSANHSEHLERETDSGGLLRYVLVTPARNEAGFIEETIKSVLMQTLLPLRWIIVSDGSTDGTDDIVEKYARQHGWIELVRRPHRQGRHFAAKVDAFNAGYAKVKDLDCNVIGNLDADVTLKDEDHFEFLMRKFADDPRLGVSGTAYCEGDVIYPYRFTSTEDVSGACQMFRRQCFQAIGGYQAIKMGGIDVVAVLQARALGWRTRTFTQKMFQHHRKVSSAHQAGAFRVLLHHGEKDFLLGSHPLWEICRSFYKMKNWPYVVGGVLLLVGYFRAMRHYPQRALPPELIYLRHDQQMRRLRRIFGGVSHRTPEPNQEIRNSTTSRP